jgi:hypothetical protein
MLFVAIALLLSLGSISWRYARVPAPTARWNGEYIALLSVCLVADLIASYGFLDLFPDAPATGRGYGATLITLSLVAAAIILGKGAFQRHETPKQRLLAWALSVTLVLVLYVLFGAISYYSTVSGEAHALPPLYTLVPITMLIILWTTTLYEHWAYADHGA